MRFRGRSRVWEFAAEMTPDARVLGRTAPARLTFEGGNSSRNAREWPRNHRNGPIRRSDGLAATPAVDPATRRALRFHTSNHAFMKSTSHVTLERSLCMSSSKGVRMAAFALTALSSLTALAALA